MKHNNSAVFLDRDGTIILDKNYLSDPSQVELCLNAKDAIEKFLKANIKIFLFTNQSGIYRKYFTLEDVLKCNEKMFELLEIKKEDFSDICIAIDESAESENSYRKPNPRFIEECVAKHNLDKSSCWMIGDRISDWQAGINAKIKSAALLYDYTYDEKSRDFLTQNKILTFDNLLDFANFII